MRRTITAIALVSLACVLLIGPAVGSAARGIVYSKTMREAEPADPDDAGITGGLFTLAHGQVERLTDVPGDVQPDVSPSGGRIVFVRAGDIYLVRSNGAEPQQLTGGPELDGSPLFSTDSRSILFTRRAAPGAPRDLYTVGTDGGPTRALTATVEDDYSAAFAGNGRAIVFVRDLPTADGGANADLYSVRPDFDRFNQWRKDDRGRGAQRRSQARLVAPPGSGGLELGQAWPGRRRGWRHRTRSERSTSIGVSRPIEGEPCVA